MSNKFYVSNRDLYNEYLKWYTACDEATQVGKEEPQIPNFIVDAIVKICTKVSYSSEFINYSYREDMISDAMLDCIRFIKSFKLKYFNKEGELKDGNPFSYITTIAISAFRRRIDKEKTQSYIKAKIISETPMHEFYESIDSEDTDMQQAFIEFIANNSDNLTNNEPMALKRKRKKAEEKAAQELTLQDDQVNLEDLMTGDEDE